MPHTQSLAQYEAATLARWNQRKHRVEVKVQLFIDRVMREKTILVANRVKIAGNFLRDMVVANLSRPVRKLQSSYTSQDASGVATKHTRTAVDPDSRSKPGEFPRADSTRLMKNIFHHHDAQRVESRIGTSLKYGLILETRMDRSFLRRTLNEMRYQIVRIVQGN